MGRIGTVLVGLFGLGLTVSGCWMFWELAGSVPGNQIAEAYVSGLIIGTGLFITGAAAYTIYDA